MGGLVRQGRCSSDESPRRVDGTPASTGLPVSTTALCPLNHPKTRLTRTTTSGAEMDQNEDIGRNRQNGSSDPANAHRSSSSGRSRTRTSPQPGCTGPTGRSTEIHGVSEAQNGFFGGFRGSKNSAWSRWICGRGTDVWMWAISDTATGARLRRARHTPRHQIYMHI